MTTYIDRIITAQYNNPERAKKMIADAMRATVGPMFDMFGKSEHTDAACAEIAEYLLPLGEVAHRECYAKLYTEDQLKCMAEFYEANPWYQDISGEMSAIMRETIAKQSGPFTEAVLDKYLSENESESV
jgi:hypothetical protein